MSRRHALLAAGASLALALPASPAIARGRLAIGGQMSMRIPWPVTSVDPHRLDDAFALLFGGALFDSLFILDASGDIVPALAETLPEPCPDGTRLTLREGMRFASGKSVTARDVVASMARSRAAGARAWLDPVGSVRATSTTTIVCAGRNPERILAALASPLAAILPEHFTPDLPDGTGPFAVRERAGRGPLVLSRNRFAALGPSMLERVTIAPAPDLASSLRAFESGEDDVGFLGLGLHEPRRGAVAFDAGLLGWAILRTGDLARGWGLPGVAQRLADGIELSRLAHLGVQGDWTVDPSEGWGGAPASLFVRDDSPWLVELARAVAVALSRGEHELTVRPVSASDLAATRTSRAYALMLDVARPYEPSRDGARVALAAADDPTSAIELVRHPRAARRPRLAAVAGSSAWASSRGFTSRAVTCRTSFSPRRASGTAVASTSARSPGRARAFPEHRI